MSSGRAVWNWKGGFSWIVIIAVVVIGLFLFSRQKLIF